LPAGDLPPEARILAAADVYEALTADRPYRGPMPREQALEIMWRDAGTAFDPECLEALDAASDGLDGVI
jgi:HD-GYP domain-containing protein (c-di-GMP phosphodiesterase class II)